MTVRVAKQFNKMMNNIRRMVKRIEKRSSCTMKQTLLFSNERSPEEDQEVESVQLVLDYHR